jgi:hypothetical protein
MSISAVSGPSSTSTSNAQPEHKAMSTQQQSSNRATEQDTVNISNAAQQAANKANTNSDSDNGDQSWG